MRLLGSDRGRLLAACVCFMAASGLALAQNWSPGVGGFVVEGDKFIRQGDYDKALGNLVKAVGLETNGSAKIDLRIMIARVYNYKGQLGKARFMLTQLARDTQDPRAQLEAARSYLYYSPYKVAEARVYLGQILDRDPNHLEALTELGYCDLNSGMLKEAAARFQQVLKKDRRVLRAHYGLAKVDFLKEDYPRAVDRLKTALEIAPENAETMFLLGNVYMGSKEIRSRDAAMNWLSRAADQEPGNVKYLAAGIFAGLCRYHPAEAESFRRRLATLDPANSYVIWAEGAYLELKAQVGSAYEKYQEALAKDWGNLYAHFCLGNMRTGFGNPEFIPQADQESWRYNRFKSTVQGVENFEMIVNNPELFPFLHTCKHNLRVLYEEPGKPDWGSPGMVKKLERMRDYGKLFNPY